MTLLGIDTREPRVTIRPLGFSGFVGIDLMRRLVSFKYEEAIRETDKAELIFDNQDGVMAEPERIALGIAMEVGYGYPGLTARPRILTVRKMKGTLTRSAGGVPVASGGKVTITYEAHGRVTDLHKILRDETRTFRSVKISDIVREVADRNGFRGPAAKIDDTPGILERVAMREDETEAQFLRRLAREAGPFDFRFTSFGFEFTSERIAEPTEVLRFFDGPDVIGVEIEGNFVLPRPGTVRSKGFDPKIGEVVTSTAETAPLGTWRAVGSAESSPVLSVEHARLRTAELIPVSKAKRKALNKAVRRLENTVNRQWKIKLTVVGNPRIRPRRTLQLENFGSLIDGPWFVREAKHSITASGGYTTEILASRKGPKRRRARTGGEDTVTNEVTTATGVAGVFGVIGAAIAAGVEGTRVILRDRE